MITRQAALTAAEDIVDFLGENPEFLCQDSITIGDHGLGECDSTVLLRYLGKFLGRLRREDFTQ